MEIDIDKAIEVLGQAAAGIATLNEEFKEACFAGKDALARQARAIREAHAQEDTLKKVADHGLFILRLNNGDWVAGKGVDIMVPADIKPIDITRYLSISPSLERAVDGAIEILTAT